MPNNEQYNGWKNRATWNVALWVGNDYGLYMSAKDYVRKSKRPSYSGFVRYAGLTGIRTPDKFSFSGRRLDYRKLTAMLIELTA